MILLLSTHKALVSAKDAEIATLKDEVAFLRNMVQPSPRLQILPYQANSILDGNDSTPSSPTDPDFSERQRVIEAEATNLLNGTY